MNSLRLAATLQTCSAPSLCARILHAAAAATLVLAPSACLAATPTFTILNNVFPATAVGQSTTQNVMLTVNTAVPITSIALAPNFTEYTLGTITGCTIDPTGVTAAQAGSTCIIPVTFSPKAPGKASAPAPIGRSAPLLVTDIENTKPAGYSFALTGTGTGPILALAPGYVTAFVGNPTQDGGGNVTGCPAQTDNLGDGCPAVDAQPYISSMALDAAGNLYIADGPAYVIQKVDAITGIISVIAGKVHTQTPYAGYGNNGPATGAEFYNPGGPIAVDQQGNIYLFDFGYNWIQKIDAATGIISIVAGGGAYGPTTGHTALNTAFPFLSAMLVDPAGNIYVSTYDNTTASVYRIDAVTQIVSVFAGTGAYTVPGTGDNGPANLAALGNPEGLAMDSAGNLYIADQANNVVRRVDAVTGFISSYAGVQPASYDNSATCESDTGNEGPANAAFVYGPAGLAFDAADNLYIAEPAAGQTCPIRRVDAKTGIIHTVAGNPFGSGFNDLDNIDAFDTYLPPNVLAVDGQGTIYFGMQYVGSAVRKITGGTSGVIYPEQSQFVTAGPKLVLASNVGIATDLTFANAPFTIQPSPSYFLATPYIGTTPQDCSVGVLAAGASCGIGISYDPMAAGPMTATETVVDNSLNVAETSHTIYISGSAYNGQTLTLTPNPLNFAAQLVGSAPTSQTVAYSNIFVTSTFTSATITGTNASSFSLPAGSTCSGTISSYCTFPVAFAPLAAGPLSATLTVVVLDSHNITQTLSIPLTGTGTTPTLPTFPSVAQLQFFPAQVNLFAGTVGSGCHDTGDNGPATSAAFCTTAATAVDQNGNTYVVDTSENTVRKIDPSGNITAFAGVPVESSNNTFSGDGGQATLANLNQPSDVAVDSAGNVYIADTENSRIRKVDTSGIITTFVGGASGHFNGGTGTGVALAVPSGITFDPAGNLYVVDNAAQLVIKVTPQGAATVFAGDDTDQGGIAGYNGDNIPANTAKLNYPTYAASDNVGNIYIADGENYRIRRVDAVTGIITTIAGNGTAGDTGDGGLAVNAEVNAAGLSTNLAGDVFVANYGTIRKIDINGNISTIAGGGSMPVGTFAIPANTAQFPGGVYQTRVDNNGSLLLPVRTSGFQVANVGPNGELLFGTEAINATSAPLTVTLENTGNALLTFSSTTYSATGDFAVTGGTCVGLASLTPGATCTLTATFTPTTAGLRTGAINVSASTNLDSQNVILQGTGAGTPALKFSPTSIAFGNVVFGSSSVATPITVTNTGTANVVFGSDTDQDSTDFIINSDTCANQTITPGSTCTINVTFTPSGVSSYSASIYVNDNVPGSPQAIPLSGNGTGTPQAAFNPTSLDFPDTPSFRTSAPLSILLTNAGSAPLTISSITLTGSNPTNFNIVSSTCGNLLANDSSCTLTLTFTPSFGAGTYSAYITVQDNASPSTLTAIIYGNGTTSYTAQMQFNPAQLSALAGTGTPQTVCADTGDGAAATAATLCKPTAAIQDATGNIYVADAGDNVVKIINPAGIITPYAGVPSPAGSFGGDNGLATAANLNNPIALALDYNGNLYISDAGNLRIREVNGDTGIITTFAGGGPGTAFNGGTGSAITLAPSGIAFDRAGNLYIAEPTQNIVVSVTPAGVATLFAGVQTLGSPGTAGYNGNGLAATASELNGPSDVFVDQYEEVWIADTNNFRVRYVSSGNMYNYAGTGVQGNSGDGGNSIDAEVVPTGVTIDLANNVYLTDGTTIRQISGENGTISTIIGGGTGPVGGQANQALLAGIGFPRIDNNGDVLIPVSTNPQLLSAGPSGFLQFGTEALNSTSAPLTITLYDVGNQGTNLDEDSFSASGDFAVTATTCTSQQEDVIPGHRAARPRGEGDQIPLPCTISVAFTPTVSGVRNGSITVASGNGNSPQTIFLQGNGAGTAPTPQAVLTPTTLAFPSITVGNTTAALTTLLSNPGSATLNISGITLTGTNPADFTISANTCQSTLAAGSTCSISVTFTPAAAASYAATLSVADDATGTPQTAALTGTGTAPQSVLTPSSLAFPTTTLGQTTSPLSATLSNPGTAPLTINSITLTGTNPADFAISTNTCQSTLAAGSTCSISITFTPTAAGSSYAATLSVIDNASESAQTVALTGSSTPVSVADFSLTAVIPTLAVQPGSTASFTFATAGVGGPYNNAISFSVTGLPTGSTGTFTPTSVIPGSNGANTILAVTTRSLFAQFAPNHDPGRPWLAILLVIPLAGLGSFRRIRRSRLLAMLLIALTLAPIVILTGCSGGYYSPGPQTYTLTVTGTSGTIHHTATVTLTVE